MKFDNGLFIFRRDLRIIDNNGLNLINSKCKNIFAIFIFTPEQVTNTNKYKSNNAVQFMIESLEDLSLQINKQGGKLYTFYGHNDTVVKKCIEHFNIDYICFNKDYTPYALERDEKIVELCKKLNIVCDLGYDYYLHEPNTIFSSSNTAYQKFTPYYEACLKKKIMGPVGARKIHFDNGSKNNPSNVNTITFKTAFEKFIHGKINQEILVHGGRPNAIKQLSIAIKTQKHYSKTHNLLNHPTTQLSAYIKFGCLSIREVYFKFKGNHDLVRQLIWRDFYANILFSFPYVLGHPMKQTYNKIRWNKSERWLELWEKGETGFPLVDAGLREMNETGYMHNRCRLIVASFLVKTLLIDWRKGEKYFATKLVDYDVASNNGNWQWVAGTGSDSSPYFRIMNPWIQSKEFDPDAEYIKKWIPELQDVPAKSIHNWYNEYTNYKNINYSKPIVDYTEQKTKALKMYSEAFH
jgi:deoxyribodipyrimidine photo-lyase